MVMSKLTYYFLELIMQHENEENNRILFKLNLSQETVRKKMKTNISIKIGSAEKFHSNNKQL
jgi:DNA-binding protein Fis